MRKMVKVPYIVWKNEFSVGVVKFNRQHRMIFEAINSLYDAMQAKNELHTVPKTLEMLTEYTKSHFIDEENFMRKRGFPEYWLHKKHHEELMVKTEEFIRQYQRGLEDISLDLLQFLKNWWNQHILSVDHKYKHFLGL